MHHHHCVPRVEATRLEDRRGRAMKQLVTDVTEGLVIGQSQDLQQETEPLLTVLATVGSPFSNGFFAERLGYLAFDCDHDQVLSRLASQDEEVRFVIPCRR